MSILIELDRNSKEALVTDLASAGISHEQVEQKHFAAEVVLFSLVVPAGLTAAQIIYQHFVGKSKEKRVFRIFVNGVEIDPSKVTVDALKDEKPSD